MIGYTREFVCPINLRILTENERTNTYSIKHHNSIGCCVRERQQGPTTMIWQYAEASIGVARQNATELTGVARQTDDELLELHLPCTFGVEHLKHATHQRRGLRLQNLPVNSRASTTERQHMLCQPCLLAYAQHLSCGCCLMYTSYMPQMGCVSVRANSQFGRN